MEYTRVIDFIIEQANRDDARNLEFEQDLLYRISRAKDMVFAKMLETSMGFSSMIEMTQMLGRFEDLIKQSHGEVVRIMINKFVEYHDMAYKNTDILLETGNDVDRQLNQRVSEMAIERDTDTIEFVQKHAFDMLSGYDTQLIDKLRAELGNLFLNKTTDRATVRNMVEKVLGVNQSKAEEIAQNELSRAYNYGVIARMHDYEKETGTRVRKYWHGFLYSPKTCGYCLSHIGNIYDLDDDSEQLPTHSRCRCTWLPILDGWDEPVSRDLISRANILTTAYSEQQIYQRINNRFGITYGELIPVDDVTNYLSGDRSPTTMSGIANARTAAIKRTIGSFDIVSETSGDNWAKKFNTQMSFWKDTVASAMVDNDRDLLERSKEGIKAVVLLPWTGEQLAKWNKLIRYIDDFLNS